MTNPHDSYRVPADQGLSTLGLLMQLCGSVFAAYSSLLLLVFMFMPSGRAGEKGLLLLAVGVSIARAVYHRAAGSELLYGTNSIDGGRSRFSGVKRYILVAAIHSGLVAFVAKSAFHITAKGQLGLGLGLAVWPALLAVMISLPRFARFANEMPIAEDKGFEGVSITMTVLGLCGALGTGAFLFVMLQAGGPLLSQGPGMLLVVALVVLLVRSIFHVHAGLTGLRETNLDLCVHAANRYANFGVIASFCAAGAILVVSMLGRGNVFIVLAVAGVCWLLLVWPLIIRRFFAERQFTDLMTDASTHRRAPDAGLTGLGWLLLGHAAFTATLLLPRAAGSVGELDSLQMVSMMGPISTKSLWWNAAIIVFQGWAGFELICMSQRSRTIATAYSVVVGALTVWLSYPTLKAIAHMGRNFAPESVMVFIPLAISLVIPIATLILVNRKVAPTATARYVPKPPSETPA